MERQARSERGWEQWPGRRPPDERGRNRLRALFSPSDSDVVAAVAPLRGTPEEELEKGMDELRRSVAELERRERALGALEADVTRILRDGASELDRYQGELSERAGMLHRRERAVTAAEATIEARRRELGAVELRRAAVDRRHEALETRETELERRAAELSGLARRLQDYGGALGRHAEAEPASSGSHLVLWPHGGYKLDEREGPPPQIGDAIEVERTPFRCVRVMPSPLPADRRRCAVLEPAPPVPS